MKVYELMKILAEMPAGAKVEAHGIIGVQEDRECEELERGVYSFSKNIDNAEHANEGTAIIFFRIGDMHEKIKKSDTSGKA